MEVANTEYKEQIDNLKEEIEKLKAKINNPHAFSSAFNFM
jgi:uncharacterized small protein (DUF1192 family)